ncbi:MAG TPA: HEAT repeat domain-containing protein [Planctomycetota bacterium]|nr:HEAT repeat domain-containing protein [Planctomycetota bacterium]
MRNVLVLVIVATVLAAGCSRLPAIEEGLKSPEWQVRYVAVGALKDYPKSKDAAALLIKALDDPSPRVRDGASDTLASFIEHRSEGVVLERVQTGSDHARLAAIAALEKSGAPPAATPFLTAMLTSQPAPIRLAAARALRGSPDPAKRAPLLAIWSSAAADEQLRIAALVSASYPAKEARSDAQVIRCYHDILRDQPDLLDTPKILQAVGDLRIIEAYPQVLRRTADPELKFLAVRSLGRMRCKEAAPALIDLLLKNESWVMNRQVCGALSRIRPEGAGRILARCFRECHPEADRDSWDRTLFITIAMLNIGGDDVFEAFASNLTDDIKRDLARFGLYHMTGTSIIWSENQWRYSWEQIQTMWREWWPKNKEMVVARLDERAKKLAEEE